MSLPIGMRLNNPGNIRDSGIRWVGMVGEEHGFCRFDTLENGLRAMAVNLHNKQSFHGLCTVAEIIGDAHWGWAPATENDTEAYVQNVAAATGYDRNAPLDLDSVKVIVALMRAIVYQEQGSAVHIPDALLLAAAQRAVGHG